MARIGNLTVDLTLKSAAFIRDMAKSSQAVATNTQRMTKSLNALTAGFGAVFSARLVRQIAGITTESLKLAASMHGPLADAARASLTQFEELHDTFEAGLARGFLDQLNGGLVATEENLKKASEAGKQFGAVIGGIGQTAGFVFGTLVPDLLANIDHGIQTYLDHVQRTIPRMQQLSFELMQTRLGIDTESKDALLAYGTAAELAAQETEAFWGAQVTATAFGEEHLRVLDEQEKILKNLRTPGEEYAATLDKIADAQLSGEMATRAHIMAAATLSSAYLQVADNVAGALGTMFRENKAIAIVQAVINTAEGITKALAAYPPPFSFLMAASVAAMGAAQIATIASAQPGTSKALTRPSGGKGGKGGATTTAGTASKSAGGGFSQTVTIKIVGDVFGPEHFRKIVSGINGVQRDGTALLQVA